MSLWYCHVCGAMFKSYGKPNSCVNYDAMHERDIFPLVSCIKYFNDPLANNYEMEIEFLESIQ